MTGVEVTTGSRLHFGLLCGASDSGWHYGGIGLMVDQPSWQLRVTQSTQAADSFDASEAVQTRLRTLVADFRRLHASLPPTHIAVINEVHFHTGLGSGTQLTLAAATALLLLSGAPRPASIADLAAMLGRSRRSAVGTFGFDRGGFVVDHGKSPSGDQLPITRIAFPDAWRMVIVTPTQSVGMSGASEETFFGDERYLEAAVVARFEELIESRIVPALQDANFADFCDTLAEYGNLVGGYYAAAQGGIYSSAEIRGLVDSTAEFNIPTPVQSSWGPSVCIPASSEQHAAEVVARIQQYNASQPLRINVARGLNTGATVRTAAPEHQRSFG